MLVSRASHHDWCGDVCVCGGEGRARAQRREDGGLNGAWGGDPRGHLEVELGRFCGCQGLSSKREELGMRPGLQGGEGLGEAFVLDFGICAVARGQVLGGR